MPASEVSSFGVFLSRVFWIIVGPMTLAILALAILNSGSGWLTAIDAAFFVILACLLAARWFEFQSGHATTATGQPTSDRVMLQYTVVALLVSVGVWVVANFLGNHVMNG